MGASANQTRVNPESSPVCRLFYFCLRGSLWVELNERIENTHNYIYNNSSKYTTPSKLSKVGGGSFNNSVDEINIMMIRPYLLNPRQTNIQQTTDQIDRRRRPDEPNNGNGGDLNRTVILWKHPASNK